MLPHRGQRRFNGSEGCLHHSSGPFLCGSIMPTRFIKESCRTSPNLQALSDFSERLFWRLLTTADDFGRCLASPAIVKATCFPLNETLKTATVTKALEELQSHRLIGLYRVGDRDYAEFCSFLLHQGAPRSKQSKFPDKSTSASICMQMHASADKYESTPHTDTDTDTDPKTDPKMNLSSSYSIDEIQLRWNALEGVKPCKRIEGALRIRLTSLIHQHPRSWWESLLMEIQGSPFLQGKTSTKNGWRATLDWAIGPKNLSKILAGNYDDTKPIHKTSTAHPPLKYEG